MQYPFWVRTYLRQKKKATIRMEAGSAGLVVPPVLIFSATTRCNLQCKDCRVSRGNQDPVEELSMNSVEELFRQASKLGVGVIMIAGGEPLLRPEILWAAGKQRDIVFPVFTNGMLLNRASISCFRHHRNLVPIITAEGGRYITDGKRGPGCYNMIIQKMEQLQRARQLYGISFILTRENFNDVTHPVWLKTHQKLGCRYFFMILDQCLSAEQKADFPGRMSHLRKQIKALFITMPENLLNPLILLSPPVPRIRMYQ